MLVGGRFDSREKRRHRKDVVITFNYDLVLDHALMRAGIPISYHLPPQHVSMPAVNNKEGLSLLKLHGSANWAVCSKCKLRVSISFDKMTSSPGIFKNLECIECHKQAFQPMLVPPSWDKTEYQKLLQPVWHQAVAELENATRICIIGYSLPESDAYFKYLLTLGLSENHGLYKFIVVDLAQQPSRLMASPVEEHIPRTKNLRERYEDLLEDMFQERRFAFHNEGLWQWMHNGSIFRDLGRGERIIRA
jgi:hypothetical protein